MGLAIKDAIVGTIVDHMFERRADGKVVLRPMIRRGIIVRVDGGLDSISAVWCKFSIGGKDEKVSDGELIRVYPARSRVARKAYRRVMGIPSDVGLEFGSRPAPLRPQVVDNLALTARQRHGVVLPEGLTEEEYEQAQEANEPTVIPEDRPKS